MQTVKEAATDNFTRRHQREADQQTAHFRLTAHHQRADPAAKAESDQQQTRHLKLTIIRHQRDRLLDRTVGLRKLHAL